MDQAYNDILGRLPHAVAQAIRFSRERKPASAPTPPRIYRPSVFELFALLRNSPEHANQVLDYLWCNTTAEVRQSLPDDLRDLVLQRNSLSMAVQQSGLARYFDVGFASDVSLIALHCLHLSTPSVPHQVPGIERRGSRGLPGACQGWLGSFTKSILWRGTENVPCQVCHSHSGHHAEIGPNVFLPLHLSGPPALAYVTHCTSLCKAPTPSRQTWQRGHTWQAHLKR